MLKWAYDYEKELNAKLLTHFYDKKNQWYYGPENNKNIMQVTKFKK